MKVIDRPQHWSNKPLRSSGENFDFLTVSYRVEFKRKLTLSNCPFEVRISLKTARGRHNDYSIDLKSIEVSATALRSLIQKLRPFVLNQTFEKLKVQCRVFLSSKICEINRQASALVKQASEVIERKFRLLYCELQGRVLTKTHTFELPVYGNNKHSNSARSASRLCERLQVD